MVLDNKNTQGPITRIIFSEKGDGLKAAYRYLARKILEEKLDALRDLR